MAQYVMVFVRSLYDWLNGVNGGTAMTVQSSERLQMLTELQIRRCSCADDLLGVIPIALYNLFPKVECCRVFLERRGSLEDAAGVIFPDDAASSGLVHCKEFRQSIYVSASNPFHALLLQHVSAQTLEKHGMSYLPILQPDRQGVLCAIVFVGDPITLDLDTRNVIELLSTGISETYLAMQALHYQSTFHLLSDLSSIEDNIAQGQLTVVRHLQNQTLAASGFLLTYSKADDDFVLKTLNDTILLEKRFPCETLPFFQSSLNLTKPLLISYSSDSDVGSDISKVGGRVSASQCLIAPVKQNTLTFGFVVLLHDETSGRSFTQDDVRMAEDSLLITGSMLYKDLVVEKERNLRIQTEKLHQVARNIFTHLDDLTILLKEIMQEARYLCHAERCSVFLLDDDRTELIAKVFDGNITSDEEVRINVGSGIAGKVVQSGEILNIKDAYSCPLFYRGVDESTGFRTRNILCFPIKDEKDVVIGAAQLCNKIGAPHFDSTDEVIAKALATYCCISILNSLMYRDVLDAHNRVKLANELMVFHMLVSNEDVEELTKQPVVPINEFGDDLHLQEFKLSVPRNVQSTSMPQAVISMVHELGFDQHFKIKSNTMARFVLMVKKGYRDPPYHNWNHAFSVAHFSYLLLRNLKCVADGVLDELEALAFFVAALCHDIDHRGTSNSFQVASNSVLAALYSSEGSVMERHHFSQTLCILNTGGCNIFESVSRREYEQLLDLIRDIILSTDIAHHLRIRGGLEAMSQEGFDKTNPEHKSLLMCLFMTSADLSDQTKPWTAARPVSKMLYKEFFSQGDLEKALGRNPMEMMDRERASIPDLQIGFIDHIVLPAFRSLRVVFPQTECLVSNIEDNREHWITIKNKTEDRRDSITSLEIFDFIDDEDEQGEASDTFPDSPDTESPT